VVKVPPTGVMIPEAV